MNESKKETWITANGSEDDFPLVFRAREHIPIGHDKDEFPIFLRIRWPYDGKERNGMPPSDVNDDQISFEDAIESIDENKIGFLMLVVTGNNRKEWIYYIKDFDIFIYEFNNCLSTHKRYPLDIYYEDEPAWDTWQNFINNLKE